MFGPVPRDYSFKLNKKVKTLARKSALAYKAQADALIVVEDFAFEAPKTKEFLSVLNDLKISNKKALFVLASDNKNVYLSARNIEKTLVVPVSSVNTYRVLNASVVVLTESALAAIDETLTK